MNFGKQGLEREQKALRATSSRMEAKAGVSILRIFLFLLIAVTVGVCSLSFGIYRGIIDNTPEISDANIMPLGFASFVYDADGNQLQKLSSVEGNRVSVSISEIPADMQHAIVAIEDSRFYAHNGVDPHGMIRAVAVALKSGFSQTEGASTITQQLLKNNVFTDWLTESRSDQIKRKLQEQYLAVQLEASLKASGQDPKAVILENYLNTVNFGSGAYGIQTASQTYFGKDCRDLTLSECAVIAAIPQNPSRFNPKIYPEFNAERRKTVLDYMLKQSYITEEAYDEALADDVYSRVLDDSSSGEASEAYSYFVDELIEQVKTALITEKGYTEVQATNAIYSGGLKIYSTQNSRIQQIMDEEFENEANYPDGTQFELDWAMTVDKADGSRKNYSREMLQNYFRQTDPSFDLLFDSAEEGQAYIDQYRSDVVAEGDSVFNEWSTFAAEPQACMTVIDQTTGHVVGIIGGRGTKSASLTLNRATDSYRQPGSVFKIISTYGPALDTGKISLAKSVMDDDYSYSDGTPIKNADDSHRGLMTIRNAIKESNNIVAVKVLTDLTPSVGYDYLQRLGFTSLTEADKIQALALGGITNGVSNLELTAAYAAIANGGTYTKPVFYTKVTDQRGNVILENTPMSSQVFKESTAWLLTDAMEDVVTSGTGANYQLALPGMAVAGKTGTTDNNHDHVFVGYTPYYTAGIWSGYDMNIELPPNARLYDSVLWTNVMNRIHSELPARDFPMPDSVEQLTVCTQTGKLAGRACPAVTEYIAKDNAPGDYCTEHVYIPPKPTPAPTVKPTPTPAAPAAGAGTNAAAPSAGEEADDGQEDSQDD